MLYTKNDKGRYHPAESDTVFAAAAALRRERLLRGHALTSQRATREFLTDWIGGRDSEAFAIVYLDNRHRVIDTAILFTGTIDGTSVYPREVVKAALAKNAAAVIFAHNHPSGVAEPSMADEAITRRLKEALAVVDIRVLDHLIVGESVVSFAERGLI